MHSFPTQVALRWAAAGFLGGLLSGASAMAQVERDPTLPPAQAPVAQTKTKPQAAAPVLPEGAQSLSLVVRDGTAYLVSDTRLYAVGQTVDGFQVERITETEIWLRRGQQVQKIQRFSGLERSIAQP